MAANGNASTSKRTTTSTTSTSTSTQSSAGTARKRTQTTQVREGLTKARNGAVGYVRQTAERTVDVPVGAALTARERVGETVEPWTKRETREKELSSLRAQVTREFNKFERRGGQARRKATQRVRQTRNRFEREVKQRRREVTKTVKENRTKVEKTVKENRVRAEQELRKRVPALS